MEGGRWKQAGIDLTRIRIWRDPRQSQETAGTEDVGDLASGEGCSRSPSLVVRRFVGSGEVQARPESEDESLFHAICLELRGRTDEEDPEIGLISERCSSCQALGSSGDGKNEADDSFRTAEQEETGSCRDLTEDSGIELGSPTGPDSN